MGKTKRIGKLAMLPALFSVMVLALGISAPAAIAQGSPTCDGMHCHSQSHCGSKCNCNPFHFTCVDNTAVD